jgi:hypothetical protein
MNCPGCAEAATSISLDSRLGTQIVIDYCTACQTFWFDDLESPRLAPSSTLQLFQIIGDCATRPRPSPPTVLRCPRCHAGLLETHDRQRSTTFQYWRCDAGDGRLISFYNFLREKDFVRALTQQEWRALSDHLQTVQCPSCGAPIDLAHDSACSHCGASLSLFDVPQAEQLIDELKRAAAPRSVDQSLPLDLERARQVSEAAMSSRAPAPEHAAPGDWWIGASASGLTATGFGALAQLLKRP